MYGLRNKWLFLYHTQSNVSHLLQPLEPTVMTYLIPQLWVFCAVVVVWA